MDSTLESVQQVASDELDKAKARFIGGRSIDRGDPDDEDTFVHSDDEGMIEEIVTTVEEDKDLECKVKKKIETKKTVAEDPETHNKITKVVKTEVTEITRTITINDANDLERAKRELGIDDVTKFLPSNSHYTTTSTSWIDQPRLTRIQEKFYDPSNEIVTSKDFPSDSPVKQHSPQTDGSSHEFIKSEQSLADATTVGRGAVVETISSEEIVATSTATNAPAPKTNKVDKVKKSKKSSFNLCSCTRSQTTDHDEEKRKQKIIEKKSKEKKKASIGNPNAIQTTNELISDEMKKFIQEKKSLIIEYFHRKVFRPAQIFTNDEQNENGRKISEEILNRLENSRSSTWSNLPDGIEDEQTAKRLTKIYEEFFTKKQSSLVNTFATIHSESDIENLTENVDYINVVQTYLNVDQTNPTNVDETLENRRNSKVIGDGQNEEKSLQQTKPTEMSDEIDKDLPIYNEEQLTKLLAEISQDKPLTLAEAIAYRYIDLEDPKLALQSETIQSMKNLFRPTSIDDDKALNIIRIKRSGEPYADFNLAETNPFEKFHSTEPLIYQLQQSFEPTLDFTEKQFRSLAEAVRNHRKEYSDLQFDIGRTLIPAGDMKESSTNDFSQSDSGYSMTTTTHESLASKVKNEFETINEPTDQQQQHEVQIDGKTDEEQEEIGSTSLEPPTTNLLESRSTTLDSTDIHAEIVEEKPVIQSETEIAPTIEAPVTVVEDVAPVTVETVHVEHLEPRPATIEPIHVDAEPTPIVIPTEKHEESVVSKALENLHGASVELPQVELVTPGPLPTITINKEKSTKKSKEKPIKTKKSSVGLCASCFGAKAAEKKKKKETANAPIEQKKETEDVPEVAATPVEINETIPSPVVNEEEVPLVSAAPCERVVTEVSVQIEEAKPHIQEIVHELPILEDRLDATIEKLVMTEEPHYQLPSSEPVPPVVQENEYTLPDTNDYDVPRAFESPKVEENTTPKDVEVPVLSAEPIESKEINETSISTEAATAVAATIEAPQIESIITSSGDDTMPNVDVKEKSSKGSYTLPKKSKKEKKAKVKKEKEGKEEKLKTEKKSSFFASIFRHSDRKSKTPALDLPAVERDLNVPGETKLETPSNNDNTDRLDPLHVPNVDLPQPDIQLPTYERPEANLTIENHHEEKSSELIVPAVELPPIPDLQLPVDDYKPVELSNDLMKVPSVELPEVQYTSHENEPLVLPEIHLKTSKETSVETIEEKVPERPVLPTIETGLALASPVNDMLDIQVNHSEFPVETDYAIKIEPIIVESTNLLVQTEEKPLINETNFETAAVDMPLVNENRTDEQVVVTPIVEETTTKVKTEIEPKTIVKKKSATLGFCSCFGSKSTGEKVKKPATTTNIAAPKAELPQVDLPLPESNISSTLKSKGPLRAPTTELPPIDLNEAPVVPTFEKKRPAPKKPVVEEEMLVTPSPPTNPIEPDVSASPTPILEVQSETSSPPVVVVPIEETILPVTTMTTSETIQTQSDSGLEAIISSHLQNSSTTQTISSGLGSEIISTATTTTSEPSGVKRENSLTRHDFAKKITLNDETRTKFIFRQEELKKCLENEISQSIEEFDAKKDQKTLNKILTHAIDLIKDKKVATYPELKQKLIIEHKNEAFIVDPVVRSLYCTLEKQGLDNIDKPEFPLAIRDMVRLPAQQTMDTMVQLNKNVEISESTPKTRSWLCGRSKVKKTPTVLPKPSKDDGVTAATSVGLLDERRRLQLNTHRQELGNILRDHIQSCPTPIRHFAEHPKEADKILRKTLSSVTQPKILSYEQIRNEFKGEFKQTFFLVDPIVDIVRDTFDHCDITQMNEKTNVEILDANILQTAQLYNQVVEQNNLLTADELQHLKSNQLTWLNSYLIDRESKEKKITSKQTKELNKILSRALNIVSLNLLYTWDDLNGQLRREFVKAHDLCDRAVELIRKAQKDGLLVLTQSPDTAEQDVTAVNIIQPNGKRRASSLITERAKQNLKTNRKQIVTSITALLYEHHKPLYTENQIQTYLNKALHHLEEQKSGQFKTYNDLKLKLKKDFKSNHENLLEQIVDVIEQAHATNQFDDIEKAEVQTLMKDRLDGKPLVIKEVYVSLPPRVGAYGNSKHSNDESLRHLSTSINGDRTLNSSTSSHRVARGLSWREANERARILFYRGKHPAIHYDEQAAGFDVRMLLETNAGGTQEIPVTDSDVHELLNSCGVQWDGVNIISLVDHSEDVVRAAEQAALKVIREKGLVDLRTPPTTRNQDEKDEPSTNA